MTDGSAATRSGDELVAEVQQLRRQLVAWQREADLELERRTEVLQRELDELRERVGAAEAARDDAVGRLEKIEASGSYHLSRRIARVVAGARALTDRSG